MKKKDKIYFFKTTNDYYQNISKWNCESNPLLYVIGISGSGKTTLVESIKDDKNILCISFDSLKFYNSSPKESQEAVDSFVIQYPTIQKYIECEWNIHSNSFFENERLFTKYLRLFNLFLIEYAIKNKKIIIVEGIQPFVRLQKVDLVNKPRIIKGTSSFQSFLNAHKRDRPSTKRRIIFRFFRYSVIQFIKLNRYMDYWNKQEKNTYQNRQSTR